MLLRAALLAVVSLVSAAFCLTTPARANDLDAHAADEFLMQLRCDASPAPTTLIAYLAKRRYLRLENRTIEDGVSCWRLDKPFDLFGLAVNRVCAGESNRFVKSLYPDVYGQSPRRFPRSLLMLATEAGIEQLRPWARVNNIPPDVFNPSMFSDARTVLGCEGSL